MGQCYSSPSSSQEHNSDQQNSSLRKKCLATVKEYRSRFYIARRCIVMLLCWQK
ncbi:hypothetical protein ACSBR2_016127 [Camellia fascicularis]